MKHLIGNIWFPAWRKCLTTPQAQVDVVCFGGRMDLGICINPLGCCSTRTCACARGRLHLRVCIWLVCVFLPPSPYLPQNKLNTYTGARASASAGTLHEDVRASFGSTCAASTTRCIVEYTADRVKSLTNEAPAAALMWDVQPGGSELYVPWYLYATRRSSLIISCVGSHPGNAIGSHCYHELVRFEVVKSAAADSDGEKVSESEPTLGK